MWARTTSSRFTVWLAILAMALNALWPLIANAKPSGVESLFEICTTQGLKAVAGDASSQGDEGAKHLQPHCPLCSHGLDKAIALPSSLPSMAKLAVVGSAIAIAPESRSFDAPRFNPARPRAPPLHA